MKPEHYLRHPSRLALLAPQDEGLKVQAWRGNTIG